MDNYEKIKKYLIENSKKFEVCPECGAHAFYVNENKMMIGQIWFKNLLGGWRLAFINDNDDWKARGVIDSVEKLKSEIELWIKNEKLN